MRTQQTTGVVWTAWSFNLEGIFNSVSEWLTMWLRYLFVKGVPKKINLIFKCTCSFQHMHYSTYTIDVHSYSTKYHDNRSIRLREMDIFAWSSFKPILILQYKIFQKRRPVSCIQVTICKLIKLYASWISKCDDIKVNVVKTQTFVCQKNVKDNNSKKCIYLVDNHHCVVGYYLTVDA